MEEKKRFTDINKWENPWFQELTLEEKLLWLFIQDDCSPIGIYRYYPRSITYHTGITKDNIPDLNIYNQSEERLVKLDHLGDNIYLIKNYIDFQYSGKKGTGLSVTSRSNFGYLNEIRDKGLWQYFLSEQREVIAPKSIKYYYAVDTDLIENTGTPSTSKIEELGITLSDIPDNYLNPQVDSTLPLNSYKYVSKEKEKEKDTDTDKGKEEDKDKSINLSITDDDIKEIKRYLNDDETIDHIFKSEIKRICKVLDGQVSLPISTIKIYSKELKEEHPDKENTVQNLIDILNKNQLAIDSTPF